MHEDRENEGKNIMGSMLTARSALLDFYADRSTSFASLFVASIFGLVTLSAIVQSIADSNLLEYFSLVLISLGLYLAFAYAGYYTFQRFKFWGNLAHCLQYYGLKDHAELEEIEVKTRLRGKLEKMKFNRFLEIAQERQKKLLLGKRSVKRRFVLLYQIMVILLGVLVYYPVFMRIIQGFLLPNC